MVKFIIAAMLCVAVCLFAAAPTQACQNFGVAAIGVQSVSVVAVQAEAPYVQAQAPCVQALPAYGYGVQALPYYGFQPQYASFQPVSAIVVNRRAVAFDRRAVQVNVGAASQRIVVRDGLFATRVRIRN